MAINTNLLSRNFKENLLILFDIIVGIISLFLSNIIILRNINFFEFFSNTLHLIIFIPIATIFFGKILGIHRMILKSFDIEDLKSYFIFSVFISFSGFIIDLSFNNLFLRSENIIFLVMFFSLGALFRAFISKYINEKQNTTKNINTKRVTIFGAGNAGRQLLLAFRNEPGIKVINFVDDSSNLHNTKISGLKVYSREKFSLFQKKLQIDEIIIALPSVNSDQRENIENFCKSLKLSIKTLPSFYELLISDNISSRLKDVKPNDFLGRSEINISQNEIENIFGNKNIFVTGGAGSIGSELCRQVLEIGINRLVILDISEISLYNIKSEFENHSLKSKIKFHLGSIRDAELINNILKNYKIDIVLHAAAYKHVPMLEDNIGEGIYNNVIGSQNLVECSGKNNIERFVFVSTDKAVKPTNIMGSTKRMAELIIKSATKKYKKTKFGIVRFGNVLGSSGSVIPHFLNQIKNGGPVTVTSYEMTRYFMAISEAALLILLAGCFAKKGEVFLLDMGKPIKIIELATKLIEVSGLSVKDKNNPYGDIEIKEIGIRPGEKLYEELLLSEEHIETPNSKIMIAVEKSKSYLDIDDAIMNLKRHIKENDINKIKNIFKSLAEYNEI